MLATAIPPASVAADAASVVTVPVSVMALPAVPATTARTVTRVVPSMAVTTPLRGANPLICAASEVQVAAFEVSMEKLDEPTVTAPATPVKM